MCLCHQPVYFGTGQGSVMPCGWEVNRRSNVALSMRHSLQWFIYLRTHGLYQGRWAPTCSPVKGMAPSLDLQPSCCGHISPLPFAPFYASSSYSPLLSAVFTCIWSLGTPSGTGPLTRKYLPGFPYSWSLRRLRQKISSIYCTVIFNYPSAAQKRPFTIGLFC